MFKKAPKGMPPDKSKPGIPKIDVQDIIDPQWPEQMSDMARHRAVGIQGTHNTSCTAPYNDIDGNSRLFKLGQYAHVRHPFCPSPSEH